MGQSTGAFVGHQDRRTFLAALGSSVRGLRAESGLTQEQLAERAEVSAKYISRIELGRQDPRASVLVRLANAMGSDIGRFLDPEVERRRNPTRWPERCARLVEDFPEQDQVRLFKILRLASGK
ncbi:MAG: helix-turn-helix transcriptional regulator [Nitrospirae bacterium]|nr:helix-turn-helix transcriptional regulator [Nitrospirota bacterium]